MLVYVPMLEDCHKNAEEFSSELEAYLARVLHQSLRLSSWPDTGQLPAFLTRRYTYYSTTISRRPCLFMAHLNGQSGTPAEIAKHIAQVQGIFDGIVAYAAPQMISHQRTRLIAQGVAFAVPGNQLYLPQLATDLREHYRARRPSSDDRLSPVAQVVLFFPVLGRNPALTTPSALSDALSYSAMSIGRAFDELVSLGLARVKKQGREKHIEFNYVPQELIEAARPYLRAPVRMTHYFEWNATAATLKLAGETALAEFTGLAPPFLQVHATGQHHWKTLRAGEEFEAVQHKEDAAIAVEVWHYDPAILSETRAVDVLSLYAQYWNHPDERVADAAAGLLKRLH